MYILKTDRPVYAPSPTPRPSRLAAATTWRSGETAASSPGEATTTVSQIVRGVRYRSYGGPIAGLRSRRLRSDEVSRMRGAFAVGTSLDQLAERYGVTPLVVRHVLTGATYSEVPGPTFEINRRGDVVRPRAPSKGQDAVVKRAPERNAAFAIHP